MKINVSAGKINFSQRNNLNKPLESCNVTSMCMALSYLGYAFPSGPYEQPEDNLRKYIEDTGKSPEVHAELSALTNKWMGKPVTNFSTGRKIKDIFNEIISGRPVVISGAFPGYPVPLKKPLGHIVCLVGSDWQGNNWNETPDFVIWDDPYGDTLNDWKGGGNDVRADYQKFLDWIKPVGGNSVKWGHFFTPIS
jgi:hypothetical protein